MSTSKMSAAPRLAALARGGGALQPSRDALIEHRGLVDITERFSDRVCRSVCANTQSLQYYLPKRVTSG